MAIRRSRIKELLKNTNWKRTSLASVVRGGLFCALLPILQRRLSQEFVIKRKLFSKLYSRQIP